MSRFTAPSWVKPSISERDIPLGAIPNCPVFGDVRASRVIPESDWLEAIRDPNRPKLWERVWHILHQNCNSCGSEALTGGIMLRRELNGRQRVLLNPLGTYHHVNGGRDGGSSLSANINFACSVGAYPDEVWSYDEGWRADPPAEADETAGHFKLASVYDIDNSSASTFYGEFFSGLLGGDPVYFGYRGHAICAVAVTEEKSVPQAARDCADEVDRWMVDQGVSYKMESVGGKVGDLLDSLYVMYLNSWGADWGWNGFGWLRASSIYRGYGAFVLIDAVESEWNQLGYYAPPA